MEIGASIFFTDYSITPAELAAALEERGFDLVWAAEHSHIPVPRRTRADTELGEALLRCDGPVRDADRRGLRDQAAPGRDRHRLVIQRDTIQTAKLVASIDQVSGGRFIFGIGGGWNQEEIENHDTVFATRMQKMREQIEAMKEIWTKPKPEYHGDIVEFDTMMTWPKPVQKPYPPIILGGAFPWAARRAVRYGDGWYPNASSGDPEQYIPAFRADGAGSRARPEIALTTSRRRAGRSRQAETVSRPRGRCRQRHADVGHARRHSAGARPLGRIHPATARIDRVRRRSLPRRLSSSAAASEPEQPSEPGREQHQRRGFRHDRRRRRHEPPNHDDAAVLDEKGRKQEVTGQRIDRGALGANSPVIKSMRVAGIGLPSASS